MVAPALQTEGKHLQREQGVGMGSSGKSEALPQTDAPSSAPLVAEPVGA
jgi:hypothetical protein